MALHGSSGSGKYTLVLTVELDLALHGSSGSDKYTLVLNLFDLTR